MSLIRLRKESFPGLGITPEDEIECPAEQVFTMRYFTCDHHGCLRRAVDRSEPRRQYQDPFWAFTHAGWIQLQALGSDGQDHLVHYCPDHGDMYREMSYDQARDRTIELWRQLA